MIKSEIICDSLNPVGDRLTTFIFEYPRFVHAEFMTHRVFSRNAASSRAIPIEKMIEQVKINPAMPVWWGKNQSGMQAKEELNPTMNIS
jgi:thymidylate synthase ThyX